MKNFLFTLLFIAVLVSLIYLGHKVRVNSITDCLETGGEIISVGINVVCIK